jgi:hypothetical protein
MKMGDRSQIAISHRGQKIYLYSHCGGTQIFVALRDCINAGRRLQDAEYFARILFAKMGAGQPGEAGYGIGCEAHADIEHVIPVVDCDRQRITFEVKDHKNVLLAWASYSFESFAALGDGEFENW